ncbi:MAG: hypothetical protein QOJ65_108, partial [Fimbriimonadaceae bacterium]|nr:hypothetical protein [Fimbriimonadaceae bacterium]
KPEYSAVDSVEIWDPKLGKVRPGGKLTTPRDRPALVELGNGKVLVIGGASDKTKHASIELYDPSTGASQVVASMSTARMAPMILPVADQGVLIAGGWVDDPVAGRAIEYLDFARNTCTVVGQAQVTRAEAAIVWLSRNEFALVGGKDSFGGRDPHAYAFQLTERFRVVLTEVGSISSRQGPPDPAQAGVRTQGADRRAARYKRTCATQAGLERPKVFSLRAA